MNYIKNTLWSILSIAWVLIIVISSAMTTGCNIIALEAEDPQGVFLDSKHKLLGNWYLIDNDMVIVNIHDYSIDYKDSYTQTGYFKSKHMPYETKYVYTNDTLHILAETEYLLSFVRK